MGRVRAVHVQAPRPALEANVPVLRWVPADADLVLVGSQLADFLSAAEQISALTPELDASALGTDPWNPDAWAQRGIDPESPIGLFVSGAAVSILLPVSDPGQVASAWSSELGQASSAWQRHRDRDVYRVQRGRTLWSWLQVEGFVILRRSPMASSAGGHGLQWLDAILDASEGSAYSGTAVAERAYALATRDRLWGSANPLPLLGTRVGGTEYLACAGLLATMQGMSFSATLSGQSASIHTSLSLRAGAATTLEALRSPGASAGMLAQRDAAGVYASLALDLQSTSVALQDAQCPQLARVLLDPLASAGWSPPPKAVHVAGTHFRPRELSGTVALDVALRNKRYINRRLNQIPGRSFFESAITVQGQRVKRLSIPTMSSLYYQLSAGRLVFATKRSIMSSLLASATDQASELGDSEAELVALGVWPERLPQLPELLKRLVPERAQREALALFLRRLAYAQFSIVLKGRRLSLHAELSPRQSAPSLWLEALW